jgi:hypothetical protein
MTKTQITKDILLATSIDGTSTIVEDVSDYSRIINSSAIFKFLVYDIMTSLTLTLIKI